MITARITPALRLAFTLCVAASSTWLAAADARYRDPSAPVPDRVEDLFRQMTPAEKIAQLCAQQFSESIKPEEVAAQLPAKLANGIGTIGPQQQFGIRDDVAFRRNIQTFLKERTRLGIPVIFHDEGCHGVMKPEATSFPMPIGLACSWDEELVRQAYDIVGREMRARGGQLTLTPVIDVARDPRWGRIEETLGEDPELIARLGTAMIQGFQGGADGVVRSEHVISTAKHFAGHGASEGGLNRSPVPIGPNELRQVHLTPFIEVIHHARPGAVMPSYNEVDGVPSHANLPLLREVLRGEMGFGGLIVSDYGGIDQLRRHGAAGSSIEAAMLSLEAGVQMELPQPETFTTLVAEYDRNPRCRELVDAAVKAVLTVKFNLGLFDRIEGDEARTRAIVESPATLAVARRAADESIVLLKNDGILPLKADKLRRIAVVGPNADITRLGGYSGTPLQCPSVLDAIRARVPQGCEVIHEVGCRIATPDSRNAYANWKANNIKLANSADNRLLINEARQAAARSDLIVLVLGDSETTTRESWGADHLGDRASIDLPGDQLELARAMFATGVPVVVYLMHGRPFALGELVQGARAIVDGWYAGQATAPAAAAILFGDVNPSGKLTVSLPRSVGHIPSHYSKKPYSATYGYLFDETDALFPFGFGLSYTTFEYGTPKLSAEKGAPDAVVTLTVDVKNTGAVAGTEVVQLYVRDEVSLPTRPRKELRDFTRVTLAPGETKSVTFTISAHTLGSYDKQLVRRAEPGWFTLWVGGSSRATQTTRYEVVR